MRKQQFVGCLLGASLIVGASVLAAAPANAATGHSGSMPTGTLASGDSISSTNGEYKLEMQGDGNVVEYGPGGRALWQTETDGNNGARLAAQSDGNLVVYSSTNAVLWQSKTGGKGATSLGVGTDGNIVMYNGSSPIWATYTTATQLVPGSVLKGGQTIRSGYSNTYTLDMQTDGNLVEYGPANQVEWQSKTNDHSGAYADFQSDGNFVVYDSSGKAIWQSKTSGTKPRNIVMQSDGNAVMYETDGSHLWNTHGVGTTVSTVTGTVAQRAIAFAEAQIGDPYVFGGAGPDEWDCSGLVMKAYASAGINVGAHDVHAQYDTATKAGWMHSYDERQPGDILFWWDASKGYYHDAIYIGNGNIVAATHPGGIVTTEAVWGHPLDVVARPVK